ncbi:hypothetical protein AG1IA_04951 [Rhizoctonia solani AG-1 IA]|uniref:Uncharacterized protein n=1 Tax=Thanatephorus cucumeris (strain AG1-IA) TaxID=983506 RepID=L8WW17_THACA|nr:hypothetical protein AG1IA_04951 [Rhizoctonia solani AG-1 IA]
MHTRDAMHDSTGPHSFFSSPSVGCIYIALHRVTFLCLFVVCGCTRMDFSGPLDYA